MENEWADPIGDINRAIERMKSISHYERIEYHHPRCNAVMGLGDCSCTPFISYHPVYKTKENDGSD